MPARPDASLEVVLDRRRRVMEQEQRALAHAERVLAQRTAALRKRDQDLATARVQLEDAQRAARLDISTLQRLEHLAQRAERDLAAAMAQVVAAHGPVAQARTQLAAAFRQVRALEIVLERRAAVRAAETRRREIRETSEIGIQVHARRYLSWGTS